MKTERFFFSFHFVLLLYLTKLLPTSVLDETIAMATGRLHDCTTQGRTHKTCGPHAYEKITNEAISMVKLSS